VKTLSKSFFNYFALALNHAAKPSQWKKENL